ncbi:MAG: hypothetical protein ABH860_02390 [bacterium]
MKQLEIQKALIDNNLKVFSKLEFRHLLRLTHSSAQQLLERYTKKGLFVRLKGGIYALKLNYPSAYLIAGKLYPPSYISFETALSYYNMIPEAVHIYASATTRTTRQFEAEKQVFSYHKIKKPAFTGYKLLKIENEKVFFAEKEKALADYLYFVFLKRKAWNDRLNLRGIDRRKFDQYAALFQKDKFTRWAKDVIRTRA